AVVVVIEDRAARADADALAHPVFKQWRGVHARPEPHLLEPLDLRQSEDWRGVGVAVEDGVGLGVFEDAGVQARVFPLPGEFFVVFDEGFLQPDVPAFVRQEQALAISWRVGGAVTGRCVSYGGPRGASKL